MDNTCAVHKKPQKDWIPYNPRTMRSPLSSNKKSVKLLSWNVNGLKALLKLEGFSALELTEREGFDVLGLQENKLRVNPLSVKYGLGIADHDSEGRIMTAEFDSYNLICLCVPNSGYGLRRLDYTMGSIPQQLHEKGNKRSASFTIEERQLFETNFLSKGFVDTFRSQYPGVVGYTYWGYRHGGRKTYKSTSQLLFQGGNLTTSLP